MQYFSDGDLLTRIKMIERWIKQLEDRIEQEDGSPTAETLAWEKQLAETGLANTKAEIKNRAARDEYIRTHGIPKSEAGIPIPKMPKIIERQGTDIMDIVIVEPSEPDEPQVP